jgi:hypothetical protein
VKDRCEKDYARVLRNPLFTETWAALPTWDSGHWKGVCEGQLLSPITPDKVQSLFCIKLIFLVILIKLFITGF